MPRDISHDRRSYKLLAGLEDCEVKCRMTVADFGRQNMQERAHPASSVLPNDRNGKARPAKAIRFLGNAVSIQTTIPTPTIAHRRRRQGIPNGMLVGHGAFRPHQRHLRRTADAQDDDNRWSHEAWSASLFRGAVQSPSSTRKPRLLPPKANKLPCTGLGAAPLNSLPACRNSFRGGGNGNRQRAYHAQSTESAFPHASLLQAKNEPPNGCADSGLKGRGVTSRRQGKRCSASSNLGTRASPAKWFQF